MFNNIVSSTLQLSRLARKFGGSARMYVGRSIYVCMYMYLDTHLYILNHIYKTFIELCNDHGRIHTYMQTDRHTHITNTHTLIHTNIIILYTCFHDLGNSGFILEENLGFL